MIEFENERALEKWLESREIGWEAWGSARSKTIDNLWKEYEQGEISFRDDPPTRAVRVVQIILRREDYMLLEIAQEFGDGRVRRRELPPSEKIIANESQYEAAERCLNEELGLDPRDIQLLNSSSAGYKRVADSPSYPGLSTQYTVYTIEALAEGLPDEDFWRENKAAAVGDPVKRH
ncbi:MAG: NUDIX domain-containing protein, partial [Candidatus Promineifilaceae bacterium]